MKVLLPLVLLVALSVVTHADVRSWRNDGTGIYPDANPPLDWKSESITLWSTAFEESNANPILVANKLFFMEEPSSLVCVDSATGDVLWKRSNELLSLLGLTDEEVEAAKATMAESERLDKEIARKLYEMERLMRSRKNMSTEDFQRRNNEILNEYMELGEVKDRLSKNDPYGNTVTPAAHPSNGYTSYTPVSDGKHVFACLGTGAVVAYDLEGKRIWHAVLDDPDHIFGGSVSPILVDGKLIIRFADYVALEPSSGEELWRTPSKTVFGTPIAFYVEEQAYLFTPRGEVIRVKDGKKVGKELVKFRFKDIDWATFNSPILSGDRLYTVRGQNGMEGDVYQFRIPKTIRELERRGLKQVWHKEIRKSRYYASPLIVDGLLYLFTDTRWLIVLDAETGEQVYEHRLEHMKGISYPSLVLAGNQIFAGTENGQVTFFEPGQEYVEVARSEVAEFRTTPVFVDDTVYIRTKEGMRAIR